MSLRYHRALRMMPREPLNVAVALSKQSWRKFCGFCLTPCIMMLQERQRQRYPYDIKDQTHRDRQHFLSRLVYGAQVCCQSSRDHSAQIISTFSTLVIDDVPKMATCVTRVDWFLWTAKRPSKRKSCAIPCENGPGSSKLCGSSKVLSDVQKN